MKVLKMVNDIQSLTGRVTSLTKATDRCAPFFKALKGNKVYDPDPFIVNLEPGDILTIYLSFSATAISSVLIRPYEGAEHSMHYVSKASQDTEVRYLDIDKLVFAMVVSARRLRSYFQAHTIHILTNQPLRQVLQKPETSSRLVKWAIELGKFDILYKPRPATKGQEVADFISEFTKPQALAVPQIITESTLPSNLVNVASNGTLGLTQPL
ncbi:unnamed protein product [Prunus armeniaca]